MNVLNAPPAEGSVDLFSPSVRCLWKRLLTKKHVTYVVIAHASFRLDWFQVNDGLQTFLRTVWNKQKLFTDGVWNFPRSKSKSDFKKTTLRWVSLMNWPNYTWKISTIRLILSSSDCDLTLDLFLHSKTAQWKDRLIKCGQFFYSTRLLKWNADGGMLKRETDATSLTK